MQIFYFPKNLHILHDTEASGQSAGGYPYPQQQQPAPGQSGGYPYPPQQQPAPGYPTQHQPASTTVYVNQPPNRTNVLAVDLGLPMAGRCGHCQVTFTS